MKNEAGKDTKAYFMPSVRIVSLENEFVRTSKDIVEKDIFDDGWNG